MSSSSINVSLIFPRNFETKKEEAFIGRTGAFIGRPGVLAAFIGRSGVLAEEETANANVSKIVKRGFSSTNEIQISERLQTLPEHASCFDTLFMHELFLLKDGSIDQTQLVFWFKNHSRVEFHARFLGNNSRRLVVQVLHSFANILVQLTTFNTIACFFDLSPRHIRFDTMDERPRLQQFDKSLLYENLAIAGYLDKVVSETTDFTCKPLEYMVLFQLLVNKETSLTASLIECICEDHLLDLTDDACDHTLFENAAGAASYKVSCKQHLKKYINKPKKDIVADLLKYVDRWDTFSLCVIYLRLVSKIIHRNSLMTHLQRMLQTNIHPDSSKRDTMQLLQDKFVHL